MPVTINTLEVENVKRVKAVALKPSPTGLTIIGGKNGAGKTTVLDAIVWALAGDRYKPSEAAREGSMTPPHIKLTLSNGLTVERKGKNAALTVTDPTGKRAGQQLLNEFISVLALDLPKFLQASSREKADTLLQIIGIGPQLKQLDDEIGRAYTQRTTVGQIRDQKQAYADELPEYPDAPEEEISAAELLSRHGAILARNAENQRERNNIEANRQKYEMYQATVIDLTERLNQAIEMRDSFGAKISAAEKTVAELVDESTAAIEDEISNIEQTNTKVRANLTKTHALEAAKAETEKYRELTRYIDEKRCERLDLLEGADLPLPELTVEDGELKYKGHSWDCMSGSEQLRVAAAIVRRLNPSCGFVLLDKLEQMDADTLTEFGSWLEQEGLQAIAARVSTGAECTIIIEDGYVAGADPAPAPKEWKAGEF